MLIASMASCEHALMHTLINQTAASYKPMQNWLHKIKSQQEGSWLKSCHTKYANYKKASQQKQPATTFMAHVLANDATKVEKIKPSNRSHKGFLSTINLEH